MHQSTYRNTNRFAIDIPSILAMLFALVVNAFAGMTTIFGNTIGGMSMLHNTPITPANFTFMIWFVIFAQWIYHAIRGNSTLKVTDYLLNASWPILFCNGFLWISYLVILAMVLRVLMQLPQQTLYATWLCVGSTIQGYIVGGYAMLFLNVVLCVIVANPWNNLVRRIDLMLIAIKEHKNPLKPILPAIIAFGVIFWALFGIAVR